MVTRNDNILRTIEQLTPETPQEIVNAIYESLRNYSPQDQNTYLKKLGRRYGKLLAEVRAEMEAYMRINLMERIKAEMGDSYESYMEAVDANQDVDINDPFLRVGFRYGYEAAMTRNSR